MQESDLLEGQSKDDDRCQFMLGQLKTTQNFFNILLLLFYVIILHASGCEVITGNVYCL